MSPKYVGFYSCFCMSVGRSHCWRYFLLPDIFRKNENQITQNLRHYRLHEIILADMCLKPNVNFSFSCKWNYIAFDLTYIFMVIILFVGFLHLVCSYPLVPLKHPSRLRPSWLPSTLLWKDVNGQVVCPLNNSLAFLQDSKTVLYRDLHLRQICWPWTLSHAL